MPFVADDLGAWLVGLLADAGRRKLTTSILGTDQERALRSAARAAIQLTSEELCPRGEDAEELALVISEVFGGPVQGEPLAGHETMLEALQAGIAGQLAVLDDAGLTGTGQSSADVLGVPGTVLAEMLSVHLLRQIVSGGSRGGPLAPLADQLSHDKTFLQDLRVEGKVDRLDDKLLELLARIDTPHAVAAAPTALAQLPPVAAGFTSRDGELTVLAGLLDPAGTGGPAVAAVAGLAGVGKTALVIQAGHAARSRGWFGGGILFIDLHGYDETPVEPAQALDALLRALGVASERIPPGLEERAGLYRSALARIPEPVLVIVDNASSEAQVGPLLPGNGPHKVLVTSRHTLAGLSARLVDVTILDKEAAAALLDGTLRAARPEDDRISRDPQATTRLMAVCSGLPLALQIVAALLKADSVLGAGDLAQELTVESRRLERLRYDDGSGASAPSVAAAFELSYRRLDDTSARVFRRLAVNPGPDVSTAAVAVLADLPATEVRAVLAVLTQAHLAEAAPGVAGRWRMHDLLRLYAQRLSDAYTEFDGRKRAQDRLLDYYLHMAAAANERLEALPGMATPEEFAGREDALTWLDAERASLIAAVTMAADVGRDQVALLLPFALSEYLSWRWRLDDWLAVSSISVAAARRLGDRHREGIALGNHLGLALLEVRRFDDAITACRDAAAIFREIGDRYREGLALGNLGLALAEVRRFEEAITAHQQDVAICREIGDRHEEAIALGGLGRALRGAQRFEEAITAHQQDLAICREIADRHGEAIALNCLGLALEGVQRFEEAITACRDAAAIFREMGDRHYEGEALDHLGLSLREIGRFDEAITAHRDAAAIFLEFNDGHRRDIALQNLKRAQAAQPA